MGYGIITIAEFKNNMPEDKMLSSGYSVVRSYMAKIDNYANVMDYKYTINQNFHRGKSVRHLKDVSFSFWDELDIVGEQYPQGICITEDYILITSYSGEKRTLGECKIFERNTGEYLVTLGLDNKSHVGGITFDGKNIWICNSAKMAVERLSYGFIKYVVENHRGGFVNVTNMVELYSVNNIPSSVTFHNGSLYVSTHTKWSTSKMISYVYDEYKDQLEEEFVYKIPAKVQGVTFDAFGRIYVSTSYGRKSSSYLKTYDSIYSMTKDIEQYIDMIEMPPCSEGIAFYEDKLYIIFESAGEKYLEGTDGNGKSIAPLDKILIIDLAKT